MISEEFKEQVFAVVGKIPQGKVMTYGQIAAFCGEPRAAWEVGQIAHYGPNDLPWQRVVNKQGGLAKGYPGGRELQKQQLEADGIKVNTDFIIDITKYLWNPESPL